MLTDVSAKMNTLLSTVDDLKIVGVRVKPEGLTQQLSLSGDGFKVGLEDRLSLQSKGYYFTHDGQLLSNEGEFQCRTKDGVIYTLREALKELGTVNDHDVKVESARHL